MQEPTYLLNNHFEIYVSYHIKDDSKYRVVGVSVNPTSTQYANCERNDNDPGMRLKDNTDVRVSWTYDVYWIVSS